MAILQAEIKRGFLRSLFRFSVNSETPFLDVLNHFQDRGFEAIKTGLLITSSSGNGKSSQFLAPAIGMQFSQDQVFALAEEFQATYAAALASLALQGNSNPDDPTIFNAMMAADNLVSITEYQNDYTALRYGFRR